MSTYVIKVVRLGLGLRIFFLVGGDESFDFKGEEEKGQFWTRNKEEEEEEK